MSKGAAASWSVADLRAALSRHEELAEELAEERAEALLGVVDAAKRLLDGMGWGTARHVERLEAALARWEQVS